MDYKTYLADNPPLTVTKKFEDKELVYYHKEGLSDVMISKIFKCSTTTVWKRRLKLRLIANFKPVIGENMTVQQMVGQRRDIQEKNSNRYKKKHPIRYKHLAVAYTTNWRRKVKKELKNDLEE